MDFIQSKINEGYTSIVITFRGKKELINGVPKITSTFTTAKYSGVDTVEKYNNLMKMVSDFPNGVSVGFMKEVY